MSVLSRASALLLVQRQREHEKQVRAPPFAIQSRVREAMYVNCFYMAVTMCRMAVGSWLLRRSAIDCAMRPLCAVWRCSVTRGSLAERVFGLDAGGLTRAAISSGLVGPPHCCFKSTVVNEANEMDFAGVTQRLHPPIRQRPSLRLSRPSARGRAARALARVPRGRPSRQTPPGRRRARAQSA